MAKNQSCENLGKISVRNINGKFTFHKGTHANVSIRIYKSIQIEAEVNECKDEIIKYNFRATSRFGVCEAFRSNRLYD